EDWVGIGFGVSVLLLVSVLVGFRRKPQEASHELHQLISPSPPTAPPSRRRGISAEGSVGGESDTVFGQRGRCGGRGPNSTPTELVPIREIRVKTLPEGLRRCVLIAPWVALLVYCVKSGMVTPARLISPYYPLLLPLLLTGATQAEIVRRRWWQALARVVMLLALPVVVLTPGRPLWPAQTILSKMLASHPNPRLASVLSRGLKVYEVYAGRWDPMANVRAL